MSPIRIILNGIPEKYPLRENWGIYDNLTDIGCYFWPEYISPDVKIATALTNIYNYEPRTIKRFNESGYIVNEESKPIVAICQLK